MLTINHASKTYNGHLVLKDVSLHIEKNKIIGLVGPSGSGKSTLLRCIQTLETLDQGDIHCDEKTGFMFQDFQLFPHMTVLQNLMYAPVFHKMLNVERDALHLLNKLGLKNKAYSYPSQLSGGQKQRVALARSLMMNPTLLLCDEPTSGLDVATIQDVVELLKSVKEERNISMIIASHDLDFLTQIADRIILLKDGNIAIDIKTKQTSDAITVLHSYY